MKGHKHQSSAIAKRYKTVLGTMPQDLLKLLEVLKKCKTKFNCLSFKLPNFNVQTLFVPLFKSLNLLKFNDAIELQILSFV